MRTRYEHHVLAKLTSDVMPSGEQRTDEELSLLCGYSPGYIRNLRDHDRDFQALVAHYANPEAEVKPPSVQERMQTLGMSTLDELQQRLAADPDSFTKRELLEIMDVLLVKARSSRNTDVAVTSPGVQVNVRFVTAEKRPRGDEAKVIEHEDTPKIASGSR